MRRFLLTILLVMALGASALPTPRPTIAAPAYNPFNPRLAINVGTTGRFNFGAMPDPVTGGAISGTSWDLSYQWPNAPSTSFTTIRIDQGDYTYGSGNGAWLQAPTDFNTRSNQSMWRTGDIEVTQSLQLVPNTQTGQEDIARIAYTVRNTSTTAIHTVGTRILTRVYRHVGAG